MIRGLCARIVGVALAASPGVAAAAGELHLFNWRDYTSPELIEAFEQAHDVEVTITSFDSEAAALETVRAGGHGFDLVVASGRFVEAYVEAGLARATRPDRMENFENVGERWRDPPWDPGRRYSVPWVWASSGVVVDTEHYQGDINTAAVIFEPPPELVGRINVAPEMNAVIGTALMYVDAEPCTDDSEALERARDLLTEARPKWLSMDYGLVEKMPRGDFAAAFYWNAAAFRARQAKPSIRYGYPREGFPLWMDNVIVLRDAPNPENAKLFQSFVMAPESAALISEFTHHGNAIESSEAFLPDAMRVAREIVIPPEAGEAGVFLPECPQEVADTYTDIWTDLMR